MNIGEQQSFDLGYSKCPRSSRTLELNYDSFVTTITYRTSQTEITSFLSLSLRSSSCALARPSASLDLLLARPTHARSLANVHNVRTRVCTRIPHGERVHFGYVARNARLMHERACTFDSTRASP